MYKLVIQDDEGKTTVVPLIRDELTIGRKEGNTIRLTERNVSRRHARLVRQNGSITIEDLNSYNGIRVNGSRIQGRCQIRETDRVQIGDYLIELKSETHEKGDVHSERTIPIERIDPHATTPVPESSEPGDSAVATTRMSKAEASAVMGASFVPPVTEPMPPMPDTDPNPGVAAPSPTATPPPVPVSHAVAHARVVVLSTNLAGREFELDKPAMVIGRTEDNDVCLNHRSISRHHAKVVRENGRHSIVDLQSSNGVRVNGEEYGKVELRRADVIDLGHVRLRFVEAGEDFVFGRDAQAIDLVPQSSSRMALWLALALLVIGAAVVLFLMIGGGTGGDIDDSGDGAGELATRAGDSSVAGARIPESREERPVVDRSDAGGEAVTPPPSDEVAKLIETARAAVNDEKWNDALTAAKNALEADPDNRNAQALVDQAQSELGNETVYKQFTRAVQNRDLTRVADQYKRLDPESVYRVKAQADHDRLKAEYIKEQQNRAKKMADRGRCKEQERLATEAGKVWAEAARAVQAYTCKQSSGTVATPGSTPGTGGETPPGTGGETPPGTGGETPSTGGETPSNGNGSAPAGSTFDSLLEQARSAAGQGEYAKSLRYCEWAMAKKPADQVAAMTCGIAACRLKNALKARKFLRRINKETQQVQMRQICLQEAVTDL
jgi:pSer/pThr/pTyr-binding forkhead associated (FHA) protein/tetratricopeptide (TPR) repeat protein